MIAVESDVGGLAVPVVESAGHQHCPSCIATMTGLRFLYRLYVDNKSILPILQYKYPISNILHK